MLTIHRVMDSGILLALERFEARDLQRKGGPISRMIDECRADHLRPKADWILVRNEGEASAMFIGRERISQVAAIEPETLTEALLIDALASLTAMCPVP